MKDLRKPAAIISFLFLMLAGCLELQTPTPTPQPSPTPIVIVATPTPLGEGILAHIDRAPILTPGWGCLTILSTRTWHKDCVCRLSRAFW
ncbi:MAG TPA: hypothetical protein VF177_13970 [Anaerolineae bacterium]